MKIGLSLFAVAAAALLAVGCGGDKGGGEDEANYDGWMLTRWKDGTALTGTVYLQLGEDGTFTLYQSIGTFGYARFTGTYALVGDPATGQVLSGTYADGTPWDSSYAVEKMTKRELRGGDPCCGEGRRHGRAAAQRRAGGVVPVRARKENAKGGPTGPPFAFQNTAQTSMLKVSL